MLDELESGLIFVNLVETDQVYGHRHDGEGFHRAPIEIDRAVASEPWRARGGQVSSSKSPRTHPT